MRAAILHGPEDLRVEDVPEPRPRDDELLVRVDAATTSWRFRSGAGACVIDTYTTYKATYREIACLVSGPSGHAVVVAAAPIRVWAQQARTLERAVSSFVG